MFIEKEHYLELLHSVKEAEYQNEVLIRENAILVSEIEQQKVTNFELMSKFTEMK